MRRDLPSGTVTFLLTDVEGSTKLLHELGAEAYAQALAEHRGVVRAAVAAHAGVEVDTQGDAFFFAFPTAPAALEAAAEAQEGLATGRIRVRMGVHTGTPLLAEEGYVGVDVHRAARIAAAGHGGQVLVSAATAALAAGDGLRNLGEHRLKDLAAAERIYQLGEGEFAPLKSLYRTNLPVPATPFLGRELELAEVGRLLEEARLLTLTGPGGTGKTRLGLQAAAEAAERHPDGVFWVPLAPLRDPALVLETVAQALGAKDGVAEHVGDKSLLLLLDNFEHLVDSAEEVAALPAACPNLRLLVTSRELLRVPGEQAYPVPPLAADDGVGLFLARAYAADPAFAADDAVPELCARLEQLPLALELAAARVRLLAPRQLLERLSQRLDLLKSGRGVDPRQQTLRATIEWSYDLLAGDEQRLFARLAVFRSGWTLEAAEQICDADLDVLQSLIDKSLVRIREGDRFWMLETIRDYALERLEASGEADELRRRHAENFLALAEEAEPEVLRATAKEWLDRLAAEHDNLRAALNRFQATAETQRALQLAGALGPFWQVRGHFPEGRRQLDAALAADGSPTAARARALVGWARLSMEPTTIATGRLRVDEALRLYEALGDAWGVAFAHWTLAGLAMTERDWARARDILEQARQEFREVGDEYHFLAVTRGLAWVHEELGDLDGYRALVEEYLDGARELGYERLLARGLGALATLAMREGRLEEALEALKESYRIDRGLGFSVFIAVDLVRFGAILVRQGSAATAARLVARSDLLHDEIGAGRESWAEEERDETVVLVRAQLSDEEFDEAWQQGRALSVDEAVALALEEAE